MSYKQREVRLLTCGHNGTGFSALVNSSNDVCTSSSSCLLNVGDSTQRFCGDNRIKLARVNCVVITSLAPHNVAGLPGLLLLLSDSVSVDRIENKHCDYQVLTDVVVIFSNRVQGT